MNLGLIKYTDTETKTKSLAARRAFCLHILTATYNPLNLPNLKSKSSFSYFLALSSWEWDYYSSSNTFLISYLKLILLLESVFSFDSEHLCFSVLKVSLKSLIVISELSPEGLDYLTYCIFCILFRKQLRFLHQRWIIFTF